MVRIGLDAPAPLTVEGKRVLVMREAGKWVAVVGVPLGARPGSKLRIEGGRRKLEVRVVAKKYPSQRLTVPKEQAELTPEQLVKYEQEREHLRKVAELFDSIVQQTEAAAREGLSVEDAKKKVDVSALRAHFVTDDASGRYWNFFVGEAVARAHAEATENK